MAVKYLWSGATGSGDGSSWANAWTSLFTNMASLSAGDTVYAAHDHVETRALETQYQLSGGTSPLTYVICVNRAGSVPPVQADLRTTAQFITTGDGSHNLKCNDNWYWYGVRFIGGSGSTDACEIRPLNGGEEFQIWDTCSFEMAGSGAMVFHPCEGPTIYGEFRNCTLKFGATSQTIRADSPFRWLGGVVGDPTGSVPTTVFYRDGSYTGEFIGTDFSFCSGNLFPSATQYKRMRFEKCKFNASLVYMMTQSNVQYELQNNFIDCGSGLTGTGTKFRVTERNGSTVDDPSIYAANGATYEGTTPYSFKAVTTSECLPTLPHFMPAMATLNLVTGANLTLTLEGIWNSASLPTNADIWFEGDYCGSASTRLGTYFNAGKPIITAASAWATSTVTWSCTTARGNSTAYTLGQAYQAQGKVFFCTTAGTSAGSEPGGLASATDGSTPVTDGSAAFRQGTRFKLTTTLSSPQPQLVGTINIRPKVGATSASVWLDYKAR